MKQSPECDGSTMRVLMLTQYYAPEPHDKWRELAGKLREQGHEVEVLTGFPCYPQGKLYPGYRQSLRGEETIDDVRVVRVPQSPDHSRSAVRRAWYYLSFALSAATLGLFRTQRPDVILVYQSALPVGFAAWVLSLFKRAPYVLDVADLWPESLAASGMITHPWLLRLVRWGAKIVYARAEQINVITEGYRESLIAMGVASEKINLVYYWPKTGQFDPPTRDPGFSEREGFAGRFSVVYAGTIGPCQDLDTALSAAASLRDLPDVQIVLVGDGIERERLEERTRRECLDNVRFLGRRDPHEVAQMFVASDLLLVHLKPDSMSRLSIPSKTFACMASGRPLLMAVEGEASRIVEAQECGEVVSPSDPQQLADAIRRHRDRPPAERRRLAENARRAHLDKFCCAVQAPKFLASLQRAVRQKRERSFSARFGRVGRRAYRRFGKRAFDIAASATLIALLSPLALLVAAAVRVWLGAPVLFSQSRPGLRGEIFELRKFRSMTDRRDGSGNLLPDEVRLTRFGRLLRAASLDELPQLWSVLRGEMSLVGPRPLLPEYLDLYSLRQARRHEVRPGITGLAQVCGRNAISWEERFEYDVRYVEDCSLALDLWIMIRTVSTVLTRRGASANHGATSPVFTGGEDEARPAA